jgi:hypothetical protein
MASRCRLRILSCLLATSAAGSAQAVTIAHEGAGCVIADRFPRFEARLDPADDVARARVFFRAAGTPHWYSVDMAPGAAGFTGVLPKPKRATARIEYYVEASDRAFASTRTPERTVDVVGSADECGRDRTLAPFTASARLVVAAAPGAPAVPAGFLGAGIAGAGGVGATTLAVVGGGAAAAAAVALGAGGGGSDAAPSPPPPSITVAVDPIRPSVPTTVPTTEPSVEPPDASIAGVWIGAGGDGLHRDITRSFQPFECHREDDLHLDLQQSGRMVSGVARFVSRAGTTCEPELGVERGLSVSGNVNGARVRLVLSTTLPGGGRSTHELVGDLAGTRIDGSATSAWSDGGQMGRGRGTWSVLRP